MVKSLETEIDLYFQRAAFPYPITEFIETDPECLNYAYNRREHVSELKRLKCLLEQALKGVAVEYTDLEVTPDTLPYYARFHALGIRSPNFFHVILFSVNEAWRFFSKNPYKPKNLNVALNFVNLSLAASGSLWNGIYSSM